MAWIRRAVIDGVLATLAGKSGLADAGKVVNFVNALATVGARVAFAVVDVNVTHLAGPTRLADAPGVKYVV